MAIKKLWTEKYRPNTIDEYIFQNEEHKQKLSEIIQTGNLPHLLLSGSQGAGKTAITEVIIKSLGIEDADVLRVNASNDNSVEFIRNTVLPFAESFAFSSPFKIVSLQEMDYLSLNSQAVLREVLEQNSDTCRFIGTCNYANKIMPAIKSRMRQYFFKAPDKEAIMMRTVEILLSEGVEIDDEALVNLNFYIDESYPDIRKIIDRLEENTKDGKLVPAGSAQATADYQFKIVDFIQAGDLQGLRDFAKIEVTNEQFNDVYELLYKHAHEFPQCNTLEAYDLALVQISQAMYRHAFVAIPQLNFEEMCIHLKKVLVK
jgi:replication factor C small subunit